jgi:TfoX/Sxy family transcriptional regulator of competence genes
VSSAVEAAVQIPRPSDADKEFFRSLVDEGGPIEVRPMFGNLGAFVNGNMYAGLFGSSVGVKLDDAGQAELLKQRGAGPYGPAERPMGGWVAMPDAWRRSPDKASAWVARALAHVQTMPPKAAKTGGRGRRPAGRGEPDASDAP